MPVEIAVCKPRNAAHQDWVHRETHPGNPQLQQSHLQGREELKEHSQGRFIYHLAPAIPVGNGSSLSTSYFKTRNQKSSASSEKLTTEYAAL